MGGVRELVLQLLRGLAVGLEKEAAHSWKWQVFVRGKGIGRIADDRLACSKENRAERRTNAGQEAGPADLRETPYGQLKQSFKKQARIILKIL